jgi:hypothetical protein
MCVDVCPPPFTSLISIKQQEEEKGGRMKMKQIKIRESEEKAPVGEKKERQKNKMF